MDMMNWNELWKTVNEGQGSLESCIPLGHKESDMT